MDFLAGSVTREEDEALTGWLKQYHPDHADFVVSVHLNGDQVTIVNTLRIDGKFQSDEHGNIELDRVTVSAEGFPFGEE